MKSKVCKDHYGAALPRTASLNFWRLWPDWRWKLAGSMLIVLHLGLVLLSKNFADGRDWPEKLVLILVGMELFAGAVYWWVVRGLREAPNNPAWPVWTLVVGAVLRVSLFITTPMIADDYYRFLWDGAVTARGVSPYAYTPSQALEHGVDSKSVPSVLHQLAKESGPLVSQINHPHLRSIYPPVAQAAFALAHGLHPWSLTAWRLVLLVFDVATLSLLIALLRILKLPLQWLVIYWWNPLLVKEIINSGHMDVVVLPFVLGSVLLALRGRHGWAALSLALAAGTKVWPVVLLPLILRPVLTSPKRLVPALGLFGLLSSVLFLPIYTAGLDSSSGLMAYSHHWEMNDALFMLCVRAAQIVLKCMGIHPGHGQFVVRIFVPAILAVWILWVVRRNLRGPVDCRERGLLIVAALFLLSPTQFPWYYVWMVPFLALRPRPSLLLLTVLLPLYYLRFYFYAHHRVEISDHGIVWLEYVPVWCLLIREWYVGRYRQDA